MQALEYGPTMLLIRRIGESLSPNGRKNLKVRKGGLPPLIVSMLDKIIKQRGQATLPYLESPLDLTFSSRLC